MKLRYVPDNDIYLQQYLWIFQSKQVKLFCKILSEGQAVIPKLHQDILPKLFEPRNDRTAIRQ